MSPFHDPGRPRILELGSSSQVRPKQRAGTVGGRLSLLFESRNLATHLKTVKELEMCDVEDDLEPELAALALISIQPFGVLTTQKGLKLPDGSVQPWHG